jgi:hypothetical protein
MPQHDMIIDNGSGAAVRTDLNNALAALASTQKGPNAPPAPVAGMFWLDDDTPSASVWTLKCYDGADWITVGTFDISANAFSSLAARFLASVLGSVAAPAFSFNGDPDTGIYSPGANQLAFALAGLEAARFENANFAVGTASALHRFTAANTSISGGAPASSGSAADPNAVARMQVGSVVIDFGAYLSGQIWLQCRNSGNYATNYDVIINPNGANIGLGTNSIGSARVAMAGPVTIEGKALQIQRGTEQATTSGTAIDFTGIPAGVRRLTLFLNNVSTNGASALAIRLGTSGGFLSTGYLGVYGIWNTGGSAYGANASGILLHNNVATESHTGVLVLENPSGNIWHARFNGYFSQAGVQTHVSYSSGILDLAGVLSQVRLTTVAGTPVFDSGSITPVWEF